jgi:hypothetical protein
LWSVDLLRNRWREIRSAVRAQDKSTEALLPDATPIAVQGHLITIGFKYDFHRSMAEKPRSKASIIAGLSQVLGADVQVQFVVGLDASPPANPDPFANDPVIQYAVQQLGAVIRPVSEEG